MRQQQDSYLGRCIAYTWDLMMSQTSLDLDGENFTVAMEVLSDGSVKVLSTGNRNEQWGEWDPFSFVKPMDYRQLGIASL